jgi:hypothetical protein
MGASGSKTASGVSATRHAENRAHWHGILAGGGDYATAAGDDATSMMSSVNSRNYIKAIDKMKRSLYDNMTPMQRAQVDSM